MTVQLVLNPSGLLGFHAALAAALRAGGDRVTVQWRSGATEAVPRGVAALMRCEDSVLSTRVADAQIEYTGKGDVARAARQGWFSRFFSMLSPF